MVGHGHNQPYTIPDASQFQVKGIPQLEELERELCKKGLRDPWIRNEAWRYHPGFGTKFQRFRNVFFRGFSLGLALTVVTVFGEKFLDKMNDGKDGGSKGGHGGH